MADSPPSDQAIAQRSIARVFLSRRLLTESQMLRLDSLEALDLSYRSLARSDQILRQR
jgi:hypothetical protein